MSESYQLVQGDTAPQIQATLTRADTGLVIDLSGATVKLYFRKKGATTNLFQMTAANTGDLENGIAVFSFAAGNLNIDPGFYEGEIEATYSGGTVETVYQVLNFQLRGDF